MQMEKPHHSSHFVPLNPPILRYGASAWRIATSAGRATGVTTSTYIRLKGTACVYYSLQPTKTAQYLIVLLISSMSKAFCDSILNGQSGSRLHPVSALKKVVETIRNVKMFGIRSTFTPICLFQAGGFRVQEWWPPSSLKPCWLHCLRFIHLAGTSGVGRAPLGQEEGPKSTQRTNKRHHRSSILEK
ncbi:hypothetical protein BU24DRAFT_418907 [Aaosphaeria arxii CBS 175.79]|uniref:Uncharacterized protein n=1 Tax=Aaosphaeria arxii CBS 175.79 TaxID=1450172 RepID=A0A6A5Y474_9PLEO|nr:uncharacterized protein BU24DRAFT_418907 [Aaosphaeria arxii CBS 175.79]KAF2019314.1 hypothetical protein BU24DRAFT_418907 [Aaosphaeria arxii CBS 175.79]